VRVLRERVGLAPAQATPIGVVTHGFTHRALHLHVFRAEAPAGRVRRRELDAHRWLSPAAFSALPLSAVAKKALALADRIVKPEGYFVAKLFQGRDTDDLVKEVKTVFREVKLLKPEATREGSREVFLIAREKRA